MANDVTLGGGGGFPPVIPGNVCNPDGGVAAAGRFQAALSDAAAGTGAAHPGPADAAAAPPSAGKEPLAQPKAPTEEQVKARLDARVAHSPLSKQAVADLLHEPSFQSLPQQSRIAILSQARNYPNGSAIQLLRLLTNKDWFREAGLEDQQRLAKTIAFDTQVGGDNEILGNTLEHVIFGSMKVRYADLSKGLGGDVLPNAPSLDGPFGTIHLNRSEMPAGNGPVPAHGAAEYVAAETLPHEVSHYVNHDIADGSYRNFMGEYRAAYVGHQAHYDYPPFRDQAYDLARRLVASTTGVYGQIGRTFQDKQSADGRRMVAFMARLMGLDPATATREQVLNPANVKGGIADALPPEWTGLPSDVDNRNNH